VTRTVASAARLARALPSFFRARVTLQEAEAAIERGIEDREKRFVQSARDWIYGNPKSPYLKLLKAAGCELADLRAEVLSRGLDATLEDLARAGVYLTDDELKGKKEVMRSGCSFRVRPKDLELPDASAGFAIQSSGTSNRPVPSQIRLDYLAARAYITAAFFSAHDLFAASHAVYDAILPAGGGVNNLLVYARIGIATDRWFARAIPGDHRLGDWYNYLLTRWIVLNGSVFGPGFPAPVFTEIGDVGRIVQWVVERRRAGKRCCITTAASNAARIARTAWDVGESLAGVRFIVDGEPFTDAKRALLERVGASATSRYAYGGGVMVGYGCAAAAAADEIHVDETRLAVIQHPVPLPDAEPAIHPLLLTTLHASAGARFLLNAASGDYADVDRRTCGCPLEKSGFTLHLSHIRSYEKLTSEGMNYFYGDVYEFFEQTLPAEFGGAAGDYQLVEEEDENGQTRLTLIVHPGVGALDENKVLLRLQRRLADGSSGNRFQAEMWRASGTYRIRRETPRASPRGKILPLQFGH
ncbi:MAG TPA: hypothetical protein VHL99_11805, partial [Candidatus Binatia bacterium]|nr:hypothetical protein [Candidatus Binatia bacterium]